MNRLTVMIVMSFVIALTVFAAKKKIIHKIDTSLCTQCGECIAGCPVQAIKAVKKNGKLIHEIDPQLCIQCGLCIENCEVNAIKVIELDVATEKKESKEKAKK